MTSAGDTNASRGHNRDRDDDDGVPEHLKCAVCLGEGSTLPPKNYQRDLEPKN
jgi:hypothetical protein